MPPTQNSVYRAKKAQKQNIFLKRRRVKWTAKEYHQSMRLDEFYHLYIHIGRHKYARLRSILDFMTELEIRKNSYSISRTPRGHMTSGQKIKW